MRATVPVLSHSAKTNVKSMSVFMCMHKQTFMQHKAHAMHKNLWEKCKGRKRGVCVIWGSVYIRKIPAHVGYRGRTEYAKN